METTTYPYVIYERYLGGGEHVGLVRWSEDELEVTVHKGREVIDRETCGSYAEASAVFDIECRRLEERADFYRQWDRLDEEACERVYPHLQDHAQVWLDEREEGR